ncbi:MAG: pyridoxamine 5'-phosphate oxidase family protein [Acidimicrobiales bacterium]
MTSNPWIRRVLLPLDERVLPDAHDEERLLLPATVLGRWFNAPVQLLTADAAAVDHYDTLAVGLGVAIEPVHLLDGDDLVAAIAGHAACHRPSVCVVAGGTGRAGELARRSSQPTFLMGPGHGHRMATGPLTVAVAGTESDIDALSVVATWAQALDEDVVIVTDGSGPADAQAVAMVQARLAEVGVGTEVVDVAGAPPLVSAVSVAMERASTALVVPASQLDDALLAEAASRGLSLLAAPDGSHRQAKPAEVTGYEARSEPVTIDLTARSGVKALTEQECRTHLARHVVARLAFIDHDRPVVVPVNYSIQGHDIFLRSLSGAKVAAAERGEIVCLEIDALDEMSHSGWSVVVHGPLTVITDPEMLRVAWHNDPNPWVDAHHWRWLHLRTQTISGRLVPAGPDRSGGGVRSAVGSGESAARSRPV